MSWLLVAAVVTPGVVALAVGLLVASRGTPVAGGAMRRIAVWASGATLVASIVVLLDAARSGRIDAVVESDEGRAVLGLTAARIEASLLVLTSFVGLIVQSFAARSLAGDARAGRFHATALLLVTATNVVATAASGWTFAAGWVATSLTVTALIGHRSGWHAARHAVRTTRATFAVGDVALVAAVAIAITSAGHLDLRSLGDAVVAIDSESAVGLIAILLVLAGIVRSAHVPLGTWLPTTLAAPTPVSALLHAGVVNGAGVLLIRFHPVIVESGLALAVAYVAGVVTAVVATSVMIVRTDVKGALVWSTAGQMGFMVAQLGAGAFAAAVFHLLGHAMYKAAAFLGAGDAISARARRAVRPGKHVEATVRSVGLSLLIGAAAVMAALLVLDPHLTDAATVMVATFATLTLARAVHGWLVTTALSAGVVVPGALLGAAAGAFAYVGGLKLVEGFVVDELPFEVLNAVGPNWVIATIVGVAVGALVVTRLPGSTGDAWRRAVYARLVGYGVAATSVGTPGAGHTSPTAAADRGARPAPSLATTSTRSPSSSASATTTSATTAARTSS